MELVELQVETVAIDWRGYPVVKLREKGGPRAIFIWIGLAEASAISMQMEGQRPPRPMTHDLIVSLLSHFGVQLERVTITDVRDATYFAELTVTMGDVEKAIDCRPSDAIAIAVRVDAPIFIEDGLLDRLDAARQETEKELSSKAMLVDSDEPTIH